MFTKSIAALIVAALPVAVSATPQDRAAPKLVQTIPMPLVKGRIDHLTVDLDGHRIFLSGLENNTVEVIDVRTGKVLSSLKDFKKPQGQAYVADLKKLYVANGDDGSCRIFDGDSLSLLHTITVSLGADALGYDPREKLMYLGSGGSDAHKETGDLTVIDVTKDAVVTTITTEAHASGSVIEESGTRVFALVAEKNQILSIDRKSHKIVDTWVIPDVQKVPSIALDEADHRLFVASRTPAKLFVLDTDSGKVVASLPTVGIVDGLSYDPDTKRIYVTGGEGFLTVHQQSDPDHYSTVAKIPTGPIARTSLFVPEWKRLYVAVPRDKDRGAELRVFDTQP